MWFNNALIYEYQYDNSQELETLMAEEALKPCPPHARFIFGWAKTTPDHFAHEIAGCALICLGKEERILPRAVINRMLEEKVLSIETMQGRSVKRAEKSQLAEDLEFELLPKSFCVQKKLFALLDSVKKRLIINTTSETQAAQLIALLRKTLPGIQIQPPPNPDDLSLRFSTWIENPTSLPASFTLAQDCLLISKADEKKKISCKGYELPALEISALLTQGLDAAEVSIIWNERIQLTLTQQMVIKRLKCLDYLVDEFNETKELEDACQQQDAALSILSGELRTLIEALQNELCTSNVKRVNEMPCTA